MEKTYQYNGLGQLVAVIENGVERRFLNDPTGLGNLAGEYDDQGNLISRYGYGLGLVAKDDHFYTFDGNGNTSEITSPAEEVVNTYAFDPFGTPLAETEEIPNAFKFSGQFGVRQTDDDLLYMRNRFYSPSLGRFMSEDPIGLAGGDVGLYRYVQNDPVNWIDPNGFKPFAGIKQMMFFSPTFRKEVNAIENISSEVFTNTTKGVVTYGPPIFVAATTGVVAYQAFPIVYPYFMPAIGTEGGQKALDFANKVAWDMYGTGQPGFTFIGQEIWSFINDSINNIFNCN